jgi:hypothetical protein
MALLLVVVPATLVTLAVRLTDEDTRRVAVGAAMAYSLLLGLASLYPIIVGATPIYFAWTMADNLIMVAAVTVDIVIRSRRVQKETKTTA